MVEERVFVALGSNLGDRAAALEGAVAALHEHPEIEILESSPVYETDPVGPPPQADYLNAVVRLSTRLSPRELLRALLVIEARAGRRRDGVRNAARTLDLDLLLYGQRSLREPGLIVPHPRMAERSFVLEPLCDLAPNLRLPGLDRSIDELARAVRPVGGLSPVYGLQLHVPTNAAAPSPGGAAGA